MPSSGPNLPTANFTNDTGIGSQAWNASYYANLKAIDGTAASTNSMNQNVISNYAKSDSFGFSIASDKTIVGIEVTLTRRASATSSIVDASVKLVKGGTISGADKANTRTYWPTSQTAVTYGSPTDLWGLTWTPSDINATNFGVAFACKNLASNGKYGYPDGIQIKVYYSDASSVTPAAPSVSISPAGQTITKDGNCAVYEVTITNNDTNPQYGGIESTFTLSASDGNSTNFDASKFNRTTISLFQGQAAKRLLIVRAKPGQSSGSNTVTVTASDSTNHSGLNGTASVTTTLSSTGSQATDFVQQYEGKVFHSYDTDKPSSSLREDGWTLAAFGSAHVAPFKWRGRSAVGDYITKTIAGLTEFVFTYEMFSEQYSGINHFAPVILNSNGAKLFYDYGTPDNSSWPSTNCYKHRIYSSNGLLGTQTPSTAEPSLYKVAINHADLAVWVERSPFGTDSNNAHGYSIASIVLGVENPEQTFGASSQSNLGVEYSNIVMSFSDIIIFTGLGASSGRKIKLYRGMNTLVATSAAADASGMVFLNCADFQFGEHGYFAVTDTDGTTIVDISDSFKLYGGSIFNWESISPRTNFDVISHHTDCMGGVYLHVPYVTGTLPDHYRLLRSDASGGTYRSLKTVKDNIVADYVPGGLILDQDYEPIPYTQSIECTSSVKVGLSFTPEISGKLIGFGAPFTRDITTIIGNPAIKYYLYAADGNGYPTGSLLAKREWLDANEIDTSTGMMRYLSFDTIPDVTAEQKYVVYIESTGTYGWKWENAGTTGYSRGEGVKYQSGAWSALGYDLPIKTYIDPPEEWGNTVFYKVQAEDASNNILATSSVYAVTPIIDYREQNNRVWDFMWQIQHEIHPKTYNGTTVIDQTRDYYPLGYPMSYAMNMMLASKMYSGSLLTKAEMITAAENQFLYGLTSPYVDNFTHGIIHKYGTVNYPKQESSRNAWMSIILWRLTKNTTYLQYAVDIAKGFVNYFPRGTATAPTSGMLCHSSANTASEQILPNGCLITSLPLTGQAYIADSNGDGQCALLFAFLYYEDHSINPFYKGNSVAVDDPYDYWAANKTYAQACFDILNAEMNCIFYCQEQASGKYRLYVDQINSQTYGVAYTYEILYTRLALVCMVWVLQLTNQTDFPNRSTWLSRTLDTINGEIREFNNILQPSSGGNYTEISGRTYMDLQFPLSWFADFANRRKLLDMCYSHGLHLPEGDSNLFMGTFGSQYFNSNPFTREDFAIDYMLLSAHQSEWLGGYLVKDLMKNKVQNII